VRILLKILVPGLLLVLAAAVGAEVVALHRAALPAPGPLVAPVVVRKAPDLLPPPKLVRTLPKPPARYHRAKVR
jgi:hypothetical protein